MFVRLKKTLDIMTLANNWLNTGYAMVLTSSVLDLLIGVILGLYRDNGKENGNYYNILG